MTAHATHAPSAAHRWMNCPGSVKLSQGFSDGGSVFAREGTAAHELAHQCLSYNFDVDEFRGWVIDAIDGDFHDHGRPADGDRFFEVTAEMVDGVQVYLDVVRELQEEGYELEYEQTLQTPISVDVFGTGDAVGYHPDRRRVVIVDLKYGKGVTVDVVGNEQLLTYGAGIAARHHNRGVDEAELIIVQPRAPHPQGPVRRWLVNIEVLQAHIEKAQAALNSDALNPGPWCKFCPAAGFCHELRFQVAKATGSIIWRTGEMTDAEDPETYSPERLAQAMADRELVAGWLKSVDRLAHNQGMKGEPPTGWKMVYAKSHRQFINPPEACQLLELYLDREDIFEPAKMRSPAQLEAELPKKARKVMAALTHSPKTKLVLVQDADPRPSVDVKSVEGFEDFDFGMEE